MKGFRQPRPELRLVPGTGTEPLRWTWFCGYCAAPAPGEQPPAPSARVCQSCGLGLLLETRQDLAPVAGDAFLVVDNALLVQAMSSRAQQMLGIREEEAVNRPIAELLVPADAEAQAPASFAGAIADAAVRAEEPMTAVVRPRNTFGIRLRARITPCGPPRAALVLLESPQARRLRAVD